MDKHPMTLKGSQALEKELKHLKNVERPTIVEAIAVARSHGDLSENADYDAAKEKQGFIEARIKDLEVKLSKAEIIDPTKLNTSKVVFGTSVLIVDVDTDEEIKYQIVGTDESDIKCGKISVHAPLAKKMISRVVGDEINVETPKGRRTYEILDITIED